MELPFIPTTVVREKSFHLIPANANAFVSFAYIITIIKSLLLSCDSFYKRFPTNLFVTLQSNFIVQNSYFHLFFSHFPFIVLRNHNSYVLDGIVFLFMSYKILGMNEWTVIQLTNDIKTGTKDFHCCVWKLCFCCCINFSMIFFLSNWLALNTCWQSSQ